jgi:hypothetical protein
MIWDFRERGHFAGPMLTLNALVENRKTAATGHPSSQGQSALTAALLSTAAAKSLDVANADACSIRKYLISCIAFSSHSCSLGWLEELQYMNRAHRCIASVLLAGAMLAPVSIIAAQPQDHDPNRVYDRDHKDYHNWDDHENQAWHHYLEENHRKDHEFAKANRKEQNEYWNWRHSHPD